MVEADRCNCGGISEIGLFACAGGANVGLMSVKAAAMVSEKLGREKAALLCLPGISAEISGIIEGAKTCRAMIAIDGCGTRCAAKTLRKAGFDPVEIVLNRDCDIAKNHDLSDKAGLEDAAEYVFEAIKKIEV
ncbi:hypothetical protein CW696_06950 [ANME-2 cluster archaeon]|nr:MAG: hypothetical protein CW696_06950 [ANME-2 cluster archaeon]